MKKPFFSAFILAGLLTLTAMPLHADEGGVMRFATLPAGPGHPEGIAADAAGKLYVADFGNGKVHNSNRHSPAPASQRRPSTCVAGREPGAA